MRFQSYFNTAAGLIKLYDGKIPLVHFLKQYFAQHKKHGSKDRKVIAHLCYGYYRLGHSLKELTIEDRLKAAIYLCNNSAGEWSVLFDENWNEWSEELQKRIQFLQHKYPSFSIQQLFPWEEALSETIDPKMFALSHLIQPDLFLRIRPGKELVVKNKLQTNQITFEELSATCLALPNASKVDNILNLDDEAVVQDHSSQRIAELLSAIAHQPSIDLWDCCAASGGKSILAVDSFPKIQLTVSDIRSSMLQNLKQRFTRAGLKKYHSFTADLSQPLTHSYIHPFNLIICDAPCSGSGTWSRTPEQLYFFDKANIDVYASLQQKIVSNVIPHLITGGYFLYITCSVFKQENENAVAFILQQFPDMQLMKKEFLKGYSIKADTMFAALFKKV